MENLLKFDDAFLGILQHLGKIEPFLDAVFFFLARRTDFFQIMKKRDDKMGFPPGVAEKIVMTIFQKHQKMVLGKVEKATTESVKKKTDNTTECQRTNKHKNNSDTTPAVHHEEVIDITEEDKHKDGPDKEMDIQLNTEKEKATVSSKSTSSRWAAADSYNGAVTEKYAWSQTSTDIDLKVALPSFVRKSKDIVVEVKTDSLKICLTKEPPPDGSLKEKIILEGKLHKNIKCDETLWSIIPGEHLQLNLEKYTEGWWTSALEDEKEIDKSKIDTTKELSEFDAQTQADFQRVVYDHHQKMQGKPTSKEQKTYDLLKEAWDAEGSPFKGTPYDPSKVNITPSND